MPCAALTVVRPPNDGVLVQVKDVLGELGVVGVPLACGPVGGPVGLLAAPAAVRNDVALAAPLQRACLVAYEAMTGALCASC